MVKWLWIIRCILAFFVSAWGSRASANGTGRLQSAIINLFDNKSAMQRFRNYTSLWTQKIPAYFKTTLMSQNYITNYIYTRLIV